MTFFRQEVFRSILAQFVVFEAGIVILVCGGRDFKDETMLMEVMHDIYRTVKIKCIVHGAAIGADTMADLWAFRLGVEVDAYPIPKEWWDRYGHSAGPRRNAKMLKDGKPQLVVAFPGENGTADMVAQAKAAGVPVLVIHSRDRFKLFLL